MLVLAATVLLLSAPSCEGRHEVRGEGGIVLEEGVCRGGERVGEWIFRFGDGSLASRGSYERGAEHGWWIERSLAGETEEGEYLLGERIGIWTIRAIDGSEMTLEYSSPDPAPRLSSR